MIDIGKFLFLSVTCSHAQACNDVVQMDLNEHSLYLLKPICTCDSYGSIYQLYQKQRLWRVQIFHQDKTQLI